MGAKWARPDFPAHPGEGTPLLRRPPSAQETPKAPPPREGLGRPGSREGARDSHLHGRARLLRGCALLPPCWAPSEARFRRSAFPGHRKEEPGWLLGPLLGLGRLLGRLLGPLLRAERAAGPKTKLGRWERRGQTEVPPPQVRRTL